VSSKVCRGCGVQKSLAEFYKHPRLADGHLSKCKVCVSARVRENRRERLEQYAQYEKAGANLPHRVEARRKYQEENKERISEYKKKWAMDNKERVAASKLAYYERKRLDILARSKKWAESNPEKVRRAKTNNLRKRRAAKHASHGSFTAGQFRELCERYDNRCLACGDAEAVLEADHVVPLTKGGSDSISIIQPLCGPCNRKKFVNIIDYRLNTNILS
jgi:5-methylcytosine-specific restriction endonuclease McrA